MVSVGHIDVRPGGGIVGDRYEQARHRQVSVQSLEELGEASERLAAPVDPSLTRRNVTVDIGRLPTTPGVRLSIGAVVLEVVRIAAPCRLLDDTIGVGAREALRRRAGVIHRTIEGGRIVIGDRLTVLSEPCGD